MRDYWTSHQDIYRKMVSDLPLCYRVHFSYSGLFYLHHVQFHFGQFFPVFWFSSACNNNKQKRGLGVRETEVLKLWDVGKLGRLLGEICVNLLRTRKWVSIPESLLTENELLLNVFPHHFQFPALSRVYQVKILHPLSTSLSLIKCLCNCKIAKNGQKPPEM